MPELIPPAWPAVWQSLLIAPTVGTDAKRARGTRTSIAKDGTLTYWCTCGTKWERREGDLIPETQVWVAEHRSHLPIEEQIDVAPSPVGDP